MNLPGILSYMYHFFTFNFVPEFLYATQLCIRFNKFYLCPFIYLYVRLSCILVYFSSSHTWQGALDTILGDTSLLVNCSRFKAFSGYSTNKTQHHDIIEIQNVLYKWY